jgi:hypothetical protein
VTWGLRSGPVPVPVAGPIREVTDQSTAILHSYQRMLPELDSIENARILVKRVVEVPTRLARSVGTRGPGSGPGPGPGPSRTRLKTPDGEASA